MVPQRLVSEDDEWGARRAGPDIDANTAPLKAIFSHYHNFASSPRMLKQERERWLLARLDEGNLDGVIFYIPPCDQYFGWRYPDLKSAAESKGLKTLLIRDDVFDVSAHPRISTQVAAFSIELGSSIAAQSKPSSANQAHHGN